LSLQRPAHEYVLLTSCEPPASSFFSHCNPVQVSVIVPSPTSTKQPDASVVVVVLVVVVVVIVGDSGSVVVVGDTDVVVAGAGGCAHTSAAPSSQTPSPLFRHALSITFLQIRRNFVAKPGANCPISSAHAAMAAGHSRLHSRFEVAAIAGVRSRVEAGG
jgi:hypothetical protein